MFFPKAYRDVFTAGPETTSPDRPPHRHQPRRHLRPRNGRAARIREAPRVTEGVFAAAVICSAIQRRLLLEFEYDGRLRVVAPYCHGLSTRGVEVLRAIQIGGASASGAFGLGKLWAVSKMLELRILDRRFTPDDPNYNPDD